MKTAQTRYPGISTEDLAARMGTDRETPGLRRELRRRGVAVNTSAATPKRPANTTAAWQQMMRHAILGDHR